MEETDLDGYLGGTERRIRFLSRALMSMGDNAMEMENDGLMAEGTLAGGMMGELGFLLSQEADRIRFVRQALCRHCSLRSVRQEVRMESLESKKGQERVRESRPSVYGIKNSKVLLPGPPFLFSWKNGGKLLALAQEWYGYLDWGGEDSSVILGRILRPGSWPDSSARFLGSIFFGVNFINIEISIKVGS